MRRTRPLGSVPTSKIAFGVESQHADVRFVAGVEEFALAVGGDGENLAFVAGGDVKSAVGAECEVPDVFRFGIEEDGFFAGRRNAIDLAVGRSGDVESAFGVEGDRLRGKIGGFKNGRWVCRWRRSEKPLRESRRRRRERLWDRVRRDQRKEASASASSVNFGESSRRPSLRTATPLRGAFEKFVVGGLAPAASVFGEERREG